LNIPHPLPRRYLAALIAAAFARTAAADPPLVADGIVLDIAPGSYATTAPSEHGLLVINGGRGAGRDVEIRTEGKDAHAVHVRGRGGPGRGVALTQSILRTTGVAAHGLAVRGTEGTGATLDTVTIITEGASAVGASFANQNAHGQFFGGRIETSGYNATGVLGENNGKFSLEDTHVITRGSRARGLIASGAGSSLETQRATIETSGDQAHAVYVDNSATATLANTAVSTTGDTAHAMNANAGIGLITVSNSSFKTSGANATAIVVYDGSRAVFRETSIDTTGDRAIGIEDRGASVGLQDSRITTRGRSAYGVLSKGGDYGSKTPWIDVRGTTIHTEGAFGYGASASGGGSVDLTNSTIKTIGANAHGLYTSDGTVSTTNTVVNTSGKNAYGAIVQESGKLSIDGGSVSTTQTAALGVHDPGRIKITGGAVVAGGNGVFAEVDAASTKAFTIELSDKAQAVGDIRLPTDTAATQADDTKLSLSITNDAQWSGASSIVRNLMLTNKGTWVVTGNSQVGTLRHDRGIVTFDPAAPNEFGVLTILGDYEGHEGLFRMRAHLGGDTSPADLVHVLGNTTGTALIAVDVLDSRGDHTNEGIPLVRVDGRSDATFRLAGRAVAGSHEYFLHKGSLRQPDDGNWYLRSTLPPPVDPDIDPEVLDPETPDAVDPPPAPSPPVLRPETGTYRANQTAALDMFHGGPGAGEDDEGDASRGSAWARFERRHTTFDFRDQITTTTSTNELTVGTDLLRGGDTHDAYAGVMAAVGQSDTRGTSLLTRYSAKGRVRGTAGGIYAGVRTKDGTYLRGWAQYAHFNQRVEGDALPSERYDSNVLTASVEAGHRWRTALNTETDAYLEPQAQLLLNRLHGGSHTEATGTRVKSRHASGSTARLGMRAAARWTTPGGHVASPYVSANWLRRLGHLDATQFDTESITGGVPRNAYSLKLGVNFLRYSGWRAWIDVESRFGPRNYRRVAGTVGVRKNW